MKLTEGVLTSPAAVGDPLSAVDTPSLVLDLDAFEFNMNQMAKRSQHSGVALRPHAKSHKSVEIARRQVAAGAVGICCQKLSEAYPFTEAGIEDIFVTNEFVGEKKVAMAVDLAHRCQLTLCVDHPSQVTALGTAARQAKVRLRLMVEVDIGQKRCGVTNYSALLDLVQCIAEFEDSLIFIGLQAFHGGAQHIKGWSERHEAVLHSNEIVTRYLLRLKDAGIDCPVVSGSGTGTAEFDLSSGLFTEIQPGSYIFLDGHYGSNEWSGLPRFRHSLFVLSTAMSSNGESRAVFDFGLKGVSVDSGLPRVATAQEGGSSLIVSRVNDEHCVVECQSLADLPKLGDKLLFVPGHCDPTVNLYQQIVCFRNGVVEDIWDIDARGLSY